MREIGSSVELLISTMYLKDLTLLQRMKVSGNCIIVNQTDFNNYPRFLLNDPVAGISVISNEERGLSRSRNLAIQSAKSEICIVADDDVIYDADYITKIESLYNLYPNADLVIFDYRTTDDTSGRVCRKIANKARRLDKLDLLKVSSVRISFKRKSIIENKLYFDCDFGAGAYFSAGEENLFLRDCLNKKLEIYYVPVELCTVDFSNSTWFKGYSKHYFYSKGAFCFAYFRNFWFLYGVYFLLVKYEIYKGQISIIDALKYMYLGMVRYRRVSLKRYAV